MTETNHRLPNTGVDYFAYGTHQVNGLELFQHLLDEAQTSGTDVTHKAWEEDLKVRLRAALDDFNCTADEDPEDDEGFFNFVAGVLSGVDVITSTARLSREERERVQEIVNLYDDDDGFDFDEVFSAVMEWLNNDCCDSGEHTYTHSYPDEGVELEFSTLGGAYLLLVTKSPFVTPCQGCSPCMPGAGDLDTPEKFFPSSASRPGQWDPSSRKWAFCLPPAWFDDDPCPYEAVYRRGESHLEIGEKVWEKPFHCGFVVPRNDVLFDAVKRRAEDLDHLIQAVKDDFCEQLPLHGSDAKAAIAYLRQDYHDRGLSGRYFILDTIANEEFTSDDL
jgi:hypothetical protein